MEEYQDLAREIQRLWKTSAKVIPTVVEALGPVASVDEYTMDVGYGKEREDRVQLLCSIRKCKDTEKGVGYFRLGVIISA